MICPRRLSMSSGTSTLLLTVRLMVTFLVSRRGCFVMIGGRRMQPPINRFAYSAPILQVPVGGVVATFAGIVSVMIGRSLPPCSPTVSYTHLRAHETRHDLV